MYCSSCGVELKEEVNFCHKCGTKTSALSSHDHIENKPKKTVRPSRTVNNTGRLSGDETYAVCSCKKYNEKELVIAKKENIQDNPIFWFLIIGAILVTVLTAGVALGPIIGIWIASQFFPTYKCKECGVKVPKKNFR